MLRCNYIFPDGRPCRCLARRPTTLCRHHTADALEARAFRAEPRYSDTTLPPSRAEYTHFWRGYHDVIRHSDESGFDNVLSDLMDALDKGVISDRSAGRLLKTLVQRRRQLQQERFTQRLIQFGRQHAALRKTGISAKGLHELLAPQLRELMGRDAPKATC